MDSVTYKTCCYCKEKKNASNFSKDKSKKSGLSSRCKKCENEKVRLWRSLNHEKSKESSRKWKKNNKEKIVEYKNKNQEKIKLQGRALRKSNLERYRAYFRRWYSENVEKARKGSSDWRKANPEKSKEYYHARVSRVRGNGGRITAEEWVLLKKFYNFTCLCCKKQEPEIKLTLDHVIPIKLGGLNVIENAQPLCGSCNCKKNAKHIDYR